MNIILDNIIFALQCAGGISVYWYELIRRMERDGRSIQVIEHPQSESNIFRRTLNLDRASLIDERSLPLWFSRYLPYPVVKGEQSLCHSSYYRRPQLANTANVVTVYDFTYERFRRGMPRWVHSMQKKAAVKAASGIICISESTKHDLLELYPDIAESKVQVIYLGASEVYRPLKSVDQRLLPSGFLSAPFVLFVGGRDSYKNFHFAIESVAALADYWFVSVGGGELKPSEAKLSQKLLPGRHIHVPAVDNERLNLFYNCAHALLYPSSYEGFGIPIIEAMAAGCPVIAANVSAIPEACGDAGLLVNEIRPEAFSDQILRLENAEFRSETIRKGSKQAGGFSWEACYIETIAFYEKVLQENSGK
jgi:glycosyltransferase involved in cell wall biosynthesis